MSLDVTHIQTVLTPYFNKQEQIILAYLFGSQARGKANIHSDVDIAVLLAGHSDEWVCFDARIQITDALMALLHINNVDVLVLNRAPFALQYHVLKDGKLLFCRDHDRRIAHQLKVINMYLDFKPILERHEQAVLAKAREGELLHGYYPHRGELKHYRALRERFKTTSDADV